MKNDRPSQTALLISKVMYLNSRRLPEFVVPATREISEKHVQSTYIPQIFRILLRTSWGISFLEFVQKMLLPGFTSHVQRRKWWIYGYTKSWCQSHPKAQLLVIGAGLDGLALEMSRQQSFQKIIEVDHPATQKAKTRLVKDSSMEFMGLDLTEKSVTDLKNTLLPYIPTLVIWEGVSMYLQEKDVQKFLRDLSQILAKDSELVWTYMLPDAQSLVRFHYGAGLIGWVLTKIKEPFLWGIPSAKLSEFVEACGWTLQKDIGTYEVPIPVSELSPEPCRGEKIAVISVHTS